MDKLIALVGKFCKSAAVNHYDQISSVYNAARSVASAAGKTDPTLSQKANSVAQSAGKLFLNADKFGLTAQTSAKYHGQIQTALDDLKGYVANKNTNPYEDTVYSAVDKAITPLQSALNSYIPESIAAQHPMQNVPQGKMGPDAPYASLLPGDKSNPFIPAKSPGPGYKVPSIDLPDQMPMAEQTIYPRKEQETVPGPNGERIALGPQDNSEEGVAHQSFNFGPNKVGPANLGPQAKLPLSKHDQERANWELPQEANDKNYAIDNSANIRMGYVNWLIAVIKNLPSDNAEKIFGDIGHKELNDWFEAGATPETAAKLALGDIDENPEHTYIQELRADRLDTLRKIAKL